MSLYWLEHEYSTSLVHVMWRPIWRVHIKYELFFSSGSADNLWNALTFSLLRVMGLDFQSLFAWSQFLHFWEFRLKSNKYFVRKYISVESKWKFSKVENSHFVSWFYFFKNIFHLDWNISPCISLVSLETKLSKMKELGSCKQTLQISTHNSQKQKS